MIKTKSNKTSVIICLVLITISSCARMAKQAPALEPQKMTIQQQDEKAMEKFQQMLETTANVNKHEVLPELEAGFHEIIQNYPDSYLSEESYLRLIVIRLEDYSPPDVDKAEEYYREYFEKYESPRLNNIMNDTMIRFYYYHQMWEKLIAFVSPYLKLYVETGVLKHPMYMFFYSDAKFNMHDIEEAKKGYKILISTYPDLYESKVAVKRMEIIDKMPKP